LPHEAIKKYADGLPEVAASELKDLLRAHVVDAYTGKAAAAKAKQDDDMDVDDDGS